MSRGFNIEEKIYQGLLLLTAHKKFFQDVEKMRKDHGIDWITGDEKKRFYDYYDGGYKTMSGRFKCTIYQYGSDDVEDVDMETQKVIYRKNPEREAYYADLEKLMKKYDLSKEYEDILDVYVQQGFVLGDVSFVTGSFDTPSISKEDGCVLVKVYPNTTKKEYDKGWKIAQMLMEYVSEKPKVLKKSIDNLERDVKIVQMKNAGMTSQEIVNKLKEDGEGTGLTYNDIDMIAHRTRNRLKKFLAHENV